MMRHGTVSCRKCGRTLEVIAIDSAGHKIVPPCQGCLAEWKAKAEAEPKEQRESQ